MARNFDGSSDYLDVTLATSQQGIATVSYSFWVFLDSNAQFRRILARDDSTAQKFRFEMDDGLGMAIVVPWSGLVGLWSPPKPSTGQWVHIVVTYDYGSTSNNPFAWYDGVSQTVSEDLTPSGTVTNDATTLRIGAHTNATQFMDGRMAELAIWERTITSGEIASLADGFSPLFFPNGLNTYLPLIGNTETELKEGSTVVLTGTDKAVHPRIIYPTSKQIRRFDVEAAEASAIRDIIGGGIVPFAR